MANRGQRLKLQKEVKFYFIYFIYFVGKRKIVLSIASF